MAITKEQADAIKAELAAEEAAAAERASEHELIVAQRRAAILRAEREWAAKLGGPVGEAFAVVDGGAEGPIVLRLGEFVLYKRFQAAIDPKITLEACDFFVRPCVVYPDAAKFGEIVERRAGLLFSCATELGNLFGKNEAATRGK